MVSDIYRVALVMLLSMRRVILQYELASFVHVRHFFNYLFICLFICDMVSVGRDSSVQRLLLSFQCTHERLVLSALCEYRLYICVLVMLQMCSSVSAEVRNMEVEGR